MELPLNELLDNIIKLINKMSVSEKDKKNDILRLNESLQSMKDNMNQSIAHSQFMILQLMQENNQLKTLISGSHNISTDIIQILRTHTSHKPMKVTQLIQMLWLKYPQITEKHLRIFFKQHSHLLKYSSKKNLVQIRIHK